MLRESTGVDRVARSRFGLSVPADQALLRVAATEAGETMTTALDLTGNRCEIDLAHFTMVPVRDQRVLLMKSRRGLLLEGALSS